MVDGAATLASALSLRPLTLTHTLAHARFGGHRPRLQLLLGLPFESVKSAQSAVNSDYRL